MKESRWYEYKDGMMYVYNSPIPSAATSVSVVGLEDRSYYRNMFSLKKIWEKDEYDSERLVYSGGDRIDCPAS